MDAREPVGERRWSVAGVPGGERFAANLRSGPSKTHLLIRGAGTPLMPPVRSGAWLVVTVGGESVTVGPYFRDAESPCWQCFRDWGLEGSAETAARIPEAAGHFVQEALSRPGRFSGCFQVIGKRTIHRILRR